MQLLLPPHIPILKTPENLLCCQVCQQKFQNRNGIGTHVARRHQLNAQNYYDRYFKTENEGSCILCHKPTKFNPHVYVYHKHCSAKCVANDPIVRENFTYNSHQKYNGKLLFQTTEFIQKMKTKPKNIPEINRKRKQTCREKYGVDYHSQLPEHKQAMSNFMIQNLTTIMAKSEQTCLKKYGSKSVMHNLNFQTQIKLTNLQKYGVENPFNVPLIQQKIQEKQLSRTMNENQKIQSKRQQTCLKKYGTKCCLQNNDIKIKTEATNIKKFGVKYPSQNKEIQRKITQTSIKSKIYILPSGQKIWKMGYEPKFLDYIFKNNILLETEIDYFPNGIKYLDHQNIERFYFPDFYIPKWNLIIEIKSTYTIKFDENILLKEQCVYQQGYRYCLIINDTKSRQLNFTKFDDFVLNNSKIEESNHV